MQAPHPTLFLHRPPIAALLQQWGEPGAGHHAPPDTATHRALQWSQWLGTVGAIRLSRTLHAIDALSADAQGQSAMPAVHALNAVFESTQAEVMALICAPAVPPKPMRARADNTPVMGTNTESDADFSVQGARFIEAQKQMQTKLGALRVRLRNALTQGPRALRQLAALDAAMDALLSEREQRLWAMTPNQLEKRLAHWHHQHQQTLQPADPLGPRPHRHPPAGWLRRFEQEAQALLTAEMQARLQPIMGLLAAAQATTTAGDNMQIKPIEQAKQVNQ